MQRTSLVMQVAEALRARLASAEDGWRMGDKVPPEHRLSLELGVGRSTIREAVRVLANEGWLEPRQGAGTFVRRNVESSPGLLSQLRRARIIEVLEARQGVEVHAARLAARRRTDDDLARMDETLQRRMDNERRGRVRAFVDADIDFHNAVVRAAHNEVLAGLFDSFAGVLRESMIDLSTHHLGREEAGASHVALADAIRRRDEDGAAEAARLQFGPTEESLRRSDDT